MCAINICLKNKGKQGWEGSSVTEPMDKHTDYPQERLNSGHSTITFEAKQPPYISEVLLTGLKSSTLKSLFKALAEELSNSFTIFR